MKINRVKLRMEITEKVLVEKFGGKLWEKNGKRRVYVNEQQWWPLLKITAEKNKKNGFMQYAMMDGSSVSSYKASLEFDGSIVYERGKGFGFTGQRRGTASRAMDIMREAINAEYYLTIGTQLLEKEVDKGKTLLDVF